MVQKEKRQAEKNLVERTNSLVSDFSGDPEGFHSTPVNKSLMLGISFQGKGKKNLLKFFALMEKVLVLKSGSWN